MNSPMDDLFANENEPAAKLLNELNATFQQMAANDKLTSGDILMMQACMTSITLQASLYSQICKRLDFLEEKLDALARSPYE